MKAIAFLIVVNAPSGDGTKQGIEEAYWDEEQRNTAFDELVKMRPGIEKAEKILDLPAAEDAVWNSLNGLDRLLLGISHQYRVKVTSSQKVKPMSGRRRKKTNEPVKLHNGAQAG